MIVVHETTTFFCEQKGCSRQLIINSTDLSQARACELARTENYWYINRGNGDVFCPEHKKRFESE